MAAFALCPCRAGRFRRILPPRPPITRAGACGGMAQMTGRPKIALIPWGDVIEDFLDPIGLSLEAFLRDMTEGWLFGYVKALKYANYAPFIVIFSAKVTEPRTAEHEPTGTPVHILPQPRAHQWLRRHPEVPIRTARARPLPMFRARLLSIPVQYNQACGFS